MCSFPPFIHDGISTSNLFHFQLPFGSDFYSYFCERELSFWSRRPIVFLYILYFKNIYDVLFILCHCYSITNCLFSFSSWIFPCISSIPDCRWQVHAYFLAKVGVPFSALVSGVQKGGVAIRGSAQFGGREKTVLEALKWSVVLMIYDKQRKVVTAFLFSLPKCSCENVCFYCYYYFLFFCHWRKAKRDLSKSQTQNRHKLHFKVIIYVSDKQKVGGPAVFCGRASDPKRNGGKK